MRHGIIAALLLVSACASAPPPEPSPVLPPVSAGADHARNRLEPLTGGGEDDAERCTHDGQWCASAGGFRNGAQTYPVEARDRAEAAPWPFVLRRADGEPLLGMLWRTHDGYSGGGASETVLVLYRFADGRAAAVFEVLQAGDALIRACFSEADVRTRREACHDDYRFSSHLSLDPANSESWPVLRYETQAETYPGRVSRSIDSAERGALTPADLYWAADESCSFTRSFVWNEAAGAYMPNAPLPACTDYRTQ